MNDVNLRIPVTFQKLDEFKIQDTRFTKVKIWLMHLEENLNGSYFSKESVLNAIPSLANTPILGYIEDNKYGEEDFSDHRHVVVKEKGKVKVKYIGSAYGVIPETNNAKFETRVCDDGKEREFLTCSGLVWNKWEEPTEILNRDEVKQESMELHDEYTGFYNEDDGLFHFADFKFFGACILGDVDVKPAMKNATVEVQSNFSVEEMWTDIQNKMEQYKQFCQHSSTDDVDINNSDEGGNLMDEKMELLKKYSLTVEFAEKNEINLDEISVEDLEIKIQEVFALSNSQLATELSMALNPNPQKDEWGWEIKDFYYFDHQDDLVFAQSRPDKWRFVSFNYSMDGDYPKVDFESKQICKFQIVPMEGQVSTTEEEFAFVPKEVLDYEINVSQKQAETTFNTEKGQIVIEYETKLKDVQDQFNALNEEVSELKTFKADKLANERVEAETELFDKFATQLTEEEIASVKETASDFTIEQLEMKLFALVGMKATKFSTTNTTEIKRVKINFGGGENVDEKPYAHLIRKHTTKSN